MQTIRLFALAMLAALSCATPIQAETQEENNTRMKWFREARFGMFIHWGLYSVAAGEWHGTKYNANVEWIQNLAKIPGNEYKTLASQFNPTQYNPDEWVRLAADAGMKYIVITTKHHDGFCLWDSAQTDWDIGATPYKKDLLKPLAEACVKHGIRLCFYHSIMDWHHPDWGNKAEWRGNARTIPNMDNFTAYLKAQLDELLAYKPGILWFDGEWESAWTHERASDLYTYLREKDPEVIVNNRIDKGRKGLTGFNSGSQFKGDFCTPEQEVPATGMPGIDWEACMTMNNTWGYSAHDQAWKSTRNLGRHLIDSASKGGNYLLNVGPTGDGRFPQPSVERLQDIAAWMKINGEAIHGTTASPFTKTPAWGRCTAKKMPGGTRLYLHVFTWPVDGNLVVTGLAGTPYRASLLANPQEEIKFTNVNGVLTLAVPSQERDAIATVIALDLTL